MARAGFDLCLFGFAVAKLFCNCPIKLVKPDVTNQRKLILHSLKDSE